MMEQPKIELRSVDLAVNLSEETPAYTARVLVDGEHFADVSNHGHGGCDNVYPPKGKEKGFRERLEALETKVAETYPEHDMSEYDMSNMKESFEGLCHNLAYEFVDRKKFKSQLSRKVLAFDDGKIFVYKGKKSEQLMDAVAKKLPNAIILNLIDFEKAWMYMKNAA